MDDLSVKDVNDAFQSIIEKVQDLNYKFSKTINFVGKDTIRISILNVSGGFPSALVDRLNFFFSEYKSMLGREDRTVVVFIKGPGPHSPYNRRG